VGLPDEVSIARTAQIADLIGLRLFGGAHLPGFQGDPVASRIWPMATFNRVTPVAAPGTNQAREGCEAGPCGRHRSHVLFH
jgi:hypothetical protein